MTAPEVPHADLIARLRGARSKWGGFPILDEAADALAALGDTVPRHEYDELARILGRALDKRDEARAERDALAIRMEVIRKALGEATPETLQAALLRVYETMHNIESPELVALHDAEVKAQALEEAAAGWTDRLARQMHARDYMNDRAAAIREGADRAQRTA